MENNKPKARRRFHYTTAMPRKVGMMRLAGEDVDNAIAHALSNCSRTANCPVRIINVIPINIDGTQYITVICEEL